MGALTAIPAQAVAARAADFDLGELRVFTSVPEHPDFGIVALAGMVVVYDSSLITREGIVENALYARERQRPPALMPWERWLGLEWEDRNTFRGPRSPLTIMREVVQVIRWPYPDDWAVRLARGGVDGPYHEWAFGRDFIGRVVGVYYPDPGVVA